MAENLNQHITIQAWAEIVVSNWEDKILKLNITDTFSLVSSFEAYVVSEANGDVQKVEFTFLYYGKFIDMGVGKGQTIREGGSRRPRKWYSPIFFSELQKLSGILAEKYARRGQLGVVENIRGTAEVKTN